jgi:chaperonin GroEL
MVTDFRIKRVQELMPILEIAAREGSPLIIVAEEVEGDALAACIMNAVRNRETGIGMRATVIKAPRYGEERREILSDLATTVGATFFSRLSGKKLKDFDLTDFGRAASIESNKHFTTIIDGKGDQEKINDTIESLKQMLKDSTSTQEAQKIQERISRLASGVAVINVGGSTDIEMGERKDRIEDALNAVRSAQLGGVVPGGGTALLMASDALNDLEAGNVDEQLGFDIVRKAIESPFRQMSNNGGYSADLKLQQIKNSADPMVCDFRTGEIIPSNGSGIIDPVKVTRAALSNAASAASTLIMADYAIILQNNT